MKKNIICLLLTVGCAVGVSACSSKEGSTNPKLVKIADNLYETTLKDDFNWGDTEIDLSSGAFACSAVQNGKFRGRNYDWTFADTDLCIIHTEKTAKRPHASVGVADLGFLKPDEKGNFNYKKLPFVTVDGINDAGVCIQVNVIPYGENGTIEHTETTKDDLSGGQVVRYILDYAGSVEQAVELIKEKDVHSEYGTLEEFHWMISGPTSKTNSETKTVVVERFPDGYHVTENFVDDKPIMTNLNVSNFDGSASSVGFGFGYERWQILSENFEQANSVMGTFDLMEKVWFSKYYDLYSDRYWYSENAGDDLCDYYTADQLKELLGEEKYNYYMETYGGVLYNPDLWDGETALHGDTSKAGILAPLVEESIEQYNAQLTDGSLWITIHTSVYDLEAKSLNIQVRECQDVLSFNI